jgi:hypothetical protein
LNDSADYQWLVGDEACQWLDEAAESIEPAHRLQERLRKFLTAERARLVVQQTELRRKGVEKFGDSAGRMFFTDLSLQQATDRWIAAYKASRFASEQAIVDYCCGIGGDLLALASQRSTTGWDRSPEMVIFAEVNARVWGRAESTRVCLGNVEDHPPTPDQQWHLDPDRRNDGRRSTHLEWHSPNEATIRSWLDVAPSGAIKLAPATVLAADWQARAELEWISHDRQCRQLIAWFGELAQSDGKHRATAIHGNQSHSFVGAENTTAEIAHEIGAFVYDTDPAIRAAKLTGALAASLACETLSPGESYLTADRKIEHPLLTGFRVIEILPLRLSNLVKHLQACNIGILEIKTRGVATDPKQVRSKLKLTGNRSVTLLLSKWGKREIAMLAKRIEASHLTDSAPSH